MSVLCAAAGPAPRGPDLRGPQKPRDPRNARDPQKPGDPRDPRAPQGPARAAGAAGAAGATALSKPSTVRVLLLSGALVLALLGLTGLEDVRRNGQVAVAITVLGAQPLVDSEPDKWTLVVPASAPARDHLRILLTVADDDPTTPTCVHRTEAILKATTPGVTPHEQRVPAQASRASTSAGTAAR